MAIANVALGDIIDPDWGNAVTNAINGVWTDVAAGSVVITQGATPTKTVAYAAWRRTGRSILYQGIATFTGAGTSSNAIVLGLPVTMRTAAGGFIRPIGGAILFNASDGLYYFMSALATTTTTAQFITTNTAIANYAGIAGFAEALASTDSLSWNIEYESAA